MESSGLALRIHVSPYCKEVLDDLGGYQLKERGPVTMKVWAFCIYFLYFPVVFPGNKKHLFDWSLMWKESFDHISYQSYHINHIISIISYPINSILFNIISYHISYITYHISHIIYHIIYHISYIIYHISYIIYHISYIIYHISYIIYHISYIIKIQDFLLFLQTVPEMAC